MKIISWNVNGIRAASKKGLMSYLSEEDPDIFCIQETKAHPEQLEENLRHPNHYFTYWSSAVKKGYSGVAIFSKTEPLKVEEGLGVEEFDLEGRTLTAFFKDFILVTGYFPNGQPDLGRVPYKLRYSHQMQDHVHHLLQQEKKPIILCGDVNTAHTEIDLARPKENEGTTGFLPEERAWVDQFVESGFVDIFREFNQDPDHYSWWSYRTNARARNVGWRIDYFFVNEAFKKKIKKSYYHHDQLGSDHCPVVLEF